MCSGIQDDGGGGGGGGGGDCKGIFFSGGLDLGWWCDSDGDASMVSFKVAVRFMVCGGDGVGV